MANCIGERICKLRIAVKETQDDLANFLNCNRASIANYENGKRTPDINTIVKIAAHYNTTTDYLLGVTSAQTNDKDIKFICDHTGLSEKSVGILNYYSNYDDYLIFVINVLIESEELGIIKDLYYDKDTNYADFSKMIDKLEESETLCIITNIYNYLTSREAENDGYISVKLNGKVENSTQINTKFRNIFANDEIAKVKHSELIEKILLDKIIDGLKKLKKIKDGDPDVNNPQT